MKNILKSGNEIYLATDDGSLIFDDNDDTYLMISLRDGVTSISKNLHPELDYRGFEIVAGFRSTEDSLVRLLEDSTSIEPQLTSIRVNKGTLKNIDK